MTTTLSTKVCGTCEKPFWRQPRESHTQYQGRLYCSVSCSNKARHARHQPTPRKPAPGGRTQTVDIRALRLLRPITADVHDPKWRDRAACADMDGDLFFPDRDDHQPAAAKNACGRCPVRRDCLTWALAADAHGIWGGTTRAQRAERTNRK